MCGTTQRHESRRRQNVSFRPLPSFPGPWSLLESPAFCRSEQELILAELLQLSVNVAMASGIRRSAKLTKSWTVGGSCQSWGPGPALPPGTAKASDLAGQLWWGSYRVQGAGKVPQLCGG